MSHSENDRVRVCMFGAAPNSGNLGVSALWHSASSALAQRIENLELTVFDHSKGVREDTLRLKDGEFAYRRIGASRSRRYYRSESMWNMRLAARIGGKWNAGLEAIRAADAVVDVSGGDSFSDIYGAHRFGAVSDHKLIALGQRAKLILLPQTYGPFEHPENRKIAEQIVRASAMAWARDARSFVALRELLGDAFDPTRHRSGVDMAFGLICYPPAAPVAEPVGRWLKGREGEIVVGVNVSGLLYGRGADNEKNFGFRADYASIIHDLVKRLLTDERVRVVLLPHVFADQESDVQACMAVEDGVAQNAKGRVATLAGRFDQCEIKWVISQLDWFCGTRMHSAIAALSTGVPTAAIAYSLKTQGVFDTCDQGEHVADPRELDTLDVVDKLEESFTARDAARVSLNARLPEVLSRVDEQMGTIADACRSSAAPETPRVSS